ncbi:MAG: GGDEF domain-containing protein [Clostridiales bacterium]|jgi:diguanylate cyclase (GGDEF)-like protein|nr:GGDEF domain-containing protein [Clostridiales bacterium]
MTDRTKRCAALCAAVIATLAVMFGGPYWVGRIGAVVCVVVFAAIISRAYDKLEYLSQRVAGLETASLSDPLTGARNRRCLSDRINRAIGEGEAFTLAMIDIDYFKRINDGFGHAWGDKVLIRIAEVMAEALAPEDVFGRYGGEEFLIIFLNQDRRAAVAKLEGINRALAAADWGVAAAVTISAGVTVYDGCDYASLLERADRNLYAAKGAGRNRVVADGG